MLDHANPKQASSCSSSCSPLSHSSNRSNGSCNSSSKATTAADSSTTNINTRSARAYMHTCAHAHMRTCIDAHTLATCMCARSLSRSVSLCLLGSTNPCKIAVRMEPFSTSIFNVFICRFAITAKICTRRCFTQAYAESCITSSHALLPRQTIHGGKDLYVRVHIVGIGMHTSMPRRTHIDPPTPARQGSKGCGSKPSVLTPPLPLPAGRTNTHAYPRLPGLTRPYPRLPGLTHA